MILIPEGSTLEIEQDVRNWHQQYLQKEFAIHMSWATEEQRAALALAVVTLFHNEHARPEEEQIDYDALARLITDEEKAITAAADEIVNHPDSKMNDEQYDEFIWNLLDESEVELGLYCRMKGLQGLEEIFGKSSSESIIVSGGFGFRNADGSWTEGSF